MVPISTSRDLIEFLMGVDFMQYREHLLYLFKLCCLSIASPSPRYPDVAIGSVSTAGHQSRFTDVILACQSHMAGVSVSVPLCSNDANLEKFSLLSTSFGQAAFSPTYDPWTVDSFGRSKIYTSCSPPTEIICQDRRRPRYAVRRKILS